MLERGSFAKFAKRERPVFTHTRLVHLKETDATGVIYFTALMDFALEAFEVFLQRENTSIEEFATRLSDAIDDYVKEADIIYTTGLTSATGGVVTGTFEGNLE